MPVLIVSANCGIGQTFAYVALGSCRVKHLNIYPINPLKSVGYIFLFAVKNVTVSLQQECIVKLLFYSVLNRYFVAF